ncbi:hypothetical protein, partial [Streptomyces sp. NPDC001020]
MKIETVGRVATSHQLVSHEVELIRCFDDVTHVHVDNVGEIRREGCERLDQVSSSFRFGDRVIVRPLPGLGCRARRRGADGTFETRPRRLMKILGFWPRRVSGGARLFGVVMGEWAGETVGPDVWETCRELIP